MNKKYFFFDIDGTLLRYNKGDIYFPESAQLAIKKLKENGHFVAICTGRSYSLAKPTMETLDIHHMISDGGNGITLDDQLIEVIPLDHQKCITLIDECNQKGFAWGIVPEISNRRYMPNSRFYELTHSSYMENIIVKDLNPNDFDKIYKVHVAILPEEENQLIHLNDLPYGRYSKEYVFVEPDNKITGIYKMMEYLQGDLKDVVVFGDSKNDLSMFSDKWISIAMGDAIDELKEKATFVTKTLEEDGIYYACKHFGWID